jgi:TM2 domain-containing membrane protein YozV
MGFMLIVLAIGLILLCGGLIRCNIRSEVYISILFTGVIIGGILSAISAMFWLLVGLDKLGENLNIVELSNKRGKYIRLLNEDYNSENLNSALNFNEKQKVCQFKESGLMWSHFNTNGVCTDTIAIPMGKFIPRQIIKIDTVTAQ